MRRWKMGGCAVVTLACSLACTGADSESTADVRIVNNYAESLFWLDYEVDGDLFGVAEEERVDIFQEVEFEDAISAEDESSVVLHFSAMSLGDMKEFDPLEIEMSRGEVYEVVYDFDLATADFVISHGWQVF